MAAAPVPGHALRVVLVEDNPDARATLGAATGRATRLVALTGYDSATVRCEALDAGFDLHVAKPCTPAKLAEILRLAALTPPA